MTRGWLGVSMQPLTTRAGAVPRPRRTRAGAIVARVYPGSPAATAGLQPNDVIVKFDGTPVDDYHHLQRLSADAEVGTSVTLDIIRKRDQQDAHA